ncbi:uncharacterized protein K452DRAFT_282124 [Aplosporella prunicola CBS 121167]|uniref:Protoporphyrinogen oxidase n=1 Tax=Aplosporella prunicola CBS 121167 TaxID=1176127 RepID=A0A6A6BSP7_9PEZI|nr:uncharacterized protein K452DRAFT_282124 [Aplosporella prunicola CBS 121167]KAF2147139.1 hypothetical protein K452DRAFT_282124 [Aplosporella prunicola CBS 121167]
MQFRRHALLRHSMHIVQQHPLKATAASRGLLTTSTLLRTTTAATPTTTTNNNNGRRNYASATAVKDVAVLGGGLTGLASAHFLARELPHAKITVYERSARVGGWLHSVRKPVPGGGEVVFEQGPRTIRQANTALAMTHLIQDLGLTNEVMYTSRKSPAALNRYIYYPNHLVLMPGPSQNLYASLYRLMTEPIFNGWMKGFFGEVFRQPRSEDVEDESVAEFLSRRLGGSTLPDNLASAVMHGIYAGDIYKLSAKSLLPFQWWLERKHGGLLKGLVEVQKEPGVPVPVRDAEFMQSFENGPALAPDFWAKLKDASVFSFKGGIQTLIDGLESSLRKHKNVTIKQNVGIKGLEKDATTERVKVWTHDSASPTKPDSLKTHDFIVSTLQGAAFSAIASPQGKPSLVPSLGDIPATTVMVVNLFFPSPALTPVRGFGYLIPRSVPFEQNPERALGVIFDSDALPGQDTAQGTKLTVMLGGHWWDGWPSEAIDAAAEDGVAAARTVLARHLGITMDPVASHVAVHRNCIPQYTVGHSAQLQRAHQDLRRAYAGRVVVAGNSYTGVGVNDCVRAARDVAMHVGADGIMPNRTGLEMFAEKQQWTRMKSPVKIGGGGA